MTTENQATFAAEYRFTVKPCTEGFTRHVVSDPKTAADFFRTLYTDDIIIYESFFAAALNTQNEVIGWIKVGQGGVSGCVVDGRLIAKFALDVLASNVIICHNHPSGTLVPSTADEQTTNRVRKALDFFGIKLLDHIIITKNSYTSI